MATSSAARLRSESISDRTATVAQDLHELGDVAKHMADHSVAAVRETARQYLDEGRSQLRHVGEDVRSRITEQPIKMLLVAAGIGFLLGAIWTHR